MSTSGPCGALCAVAHISSSEQSLSFEHRWSREDHHPTTQIILHQALPSDQEPTCSVLPSKSCSCSPTAGFNPTFGPAWVPLYGSLPSGRFRDGLQSLNEGLGEGIWFRGRLLVAVSMEVFEGRVEPKSSQTTQGSRLSRLTGKKKKKKEKGRQAQTPAGSLQPANASTGKDVPEIPSAMEVEVEELLPLPEVGRGWSHPRHQTS